MRLGFVKSKTLFPLATALAFLYLCLRKNSNAMKTDAEKNPAFNPYVSVDCVLFGYDGESLKVLLVRQCEASADDADSAPPTPASESAATEPSVWKLPGSIIYQEEGLDEAAQRVLYELTGLNNIPLHQFRAFGETDRTSNPRDVRWLRRFHKLNARFERIVTVAYFALVKINRRFTPLSSGYEACWTPLDRLGFLAFDHNRIVESAREFLYRHAENHPDILFNILPRKFTVAELRKLFEVFYGHTYDVRNFHKKIARMPYLFPLDEKEEGVAHRAARYYRFDRVRYNQYRKVK
jgi:ADP-ribose pyrophosphatase YjhB (NUDIX family)